MREVNLTYATHPESPPHSAGARVDSFCDSSVGRNLARWDAAGNRDQHVVGDRTGRERKLRACVLFT